ncbi:DMT family transporter [Solimonas terrae]|uniref:DMT family transporter n=1 Tax=Solimonas terrae TaxID=1396819 RepID=A0A6M2BX65_9GAMM|nr:DMT family transporter [Solimonas terrae]NGY06477.1 DMT family transporter [Solimonas terrae]
MSSPLKPQLQIHLCVLLWGFTAILGKLIALPATVLVWWRMVLVLMVLACVPRVWRGLRALPRQLVAVYAGIGLLVTLHWLTFFAAIKLANASVAATCIALGPVFLSLIEPWVAGRRVDLREMLLGVLVVPGVALVVGGIPTGMRLGLLVGVSSALFVACFSALNKRYVERADALLVTTLELGTGAVVLTAVLPWSNGHGFSPDVFMLPAPNDLALLSLLAFACTLLPFNLSLIALRRLSAFAALLAVNLEPVYAILLAIAVLGEQRELGISFYAGVVVILSTVLLHPWLMRSRRIPAAATLAVAEAKNLVD